MQYKKSAAGPSILARAFRALLLTLIYHIHTHTYVFSDPLSGRERQVLQLVGEGKSTKDIAAQLGISVKTAESHRARLMKKLDIHEIASLVRYAIRHGLIQP